MTKREIMKAVLQQIENQFYSELICEDGASNFQYWCEEQFDNEDDPQACYKLAEDIAPFVNWLEWELAKFAEIY